MEKSKSIKGVPKVDRIHSILTQAHELSPTNNESSREEAFALLPQTDGVAIVSPTVHHTLQEGEHPTEKYAKLEKELEEAKLQFEALSQLFKLQHNELKQRDKEIKHLKYKLRQAENPQKQVDLKPNENASKQFTKSIKSETVIPEAEPDISDFLSVDNYFVSNTGLVKVPSNNDDGDNHAGSAIENKNTLAVKKRETTVNNQTMELNRTTLKRKPDCSDDNDDEAEHQVQVIKKQKFSEKASASTSDKDGKSQNDVEKDNEEKDDAGNDNENNLLKEIMNRRSFKALLGKMKRAGFIGQETLSIEHREKIAEVYNELHHTRIETKAFLSIVAVKLKAAGYNRTTPLAKKTNENDHPIDKPPLPAGSPPTKGLACTYDHYLTHTPTPPPFPEHLDPTYYSVPSIPSIPSIPYHEYDDRYDYAWDSRRDHYSQPLPPPVPAVSYDHWDDRRGSYPIGVEESYYSSAHPFPRRETSFYPPSPGDSYTMTNNHRYRDDSRHYSRSRSDRYY